MDLECFAFIELEVFARAFVADLWVFLGDLDFILPSDHLFDILGFSLDDGHGSKVFSCLKLFV